MGRVFPVVPLAEVYGTVGSIAKRYEKTDELHTTITVASGTSSGSSTITLPSNVQTTDILVIRAYPGANLTKTWRITIQDQNGNKIYQYSGLASDEELVDSNLRITVKGNLTVIINTAGNVVNDVNFDVYLGVRETVLEA